MSDSVIIISDIDFILWASNFGTN